MIRTVEQGCFDIENRITGDDSTRQRFLNTFVDNADILARYGTTDDFIDELVTFAGIWFELNPDMTVLTTTTGLSDELAFAIGLCLNRFSIGNLRVPNRCFNLELAFHPIDDNLEVQFAHAGNNRLTCFRIGIGSEGRILFWQLLQGGAHLFLILLGFGFNRNRDDWFRKTHRFQNDVLVHWTERITGNGVFKADCGSDITRIDFFDFRPGVRVHL